MSVSNRPLSAHKLLTLLRAMMHKHTTSSFRVCFWRSAKPEEHRLWNMSLNISKYSGTQNVSEACG
jgi:hypothetical protein